MSLSIKKLKELLSAQDLIPNKYFIMDGDVFYIELFSTKTGELFLLYIPSKYVFKVDRSISPEVVYKIKYIDMKTEDNKTDEYGGECQNAEAIYEKVNLSQREDDVEEQLENNYKQEITLNDISADDKIHLKTIYRQMKRLKFCVQNIKYKLAIMYKNYICSIRRDDTIDCFIIKHYPKKKVKKLAIIVDLETLYNKNEKISEDTFTVRESIQAVIEKNHNSHTQVISKIMESKKELNRLPDKIHKKRDYYQHMLSIMEHYLSIIVTKETELLEKIKKYNVTEGNSSLSRDINTAHEKSKLEYDLNKLRTLNSKIVSVIIEIREKISDSMLNIDEILFDNTVMFDCMVKNFANLKLYY